MCKGIIDEMRVYETDDESYSHWIGDYSSVDSSMGKWYPLDADIYDGEEGSSSYLTGESYTFLYYPNCFHRTHTSSIIVCSHTIGESNLWAGVGFVMGVIYRGIGAVAVTFICTKEI